MLTHLMYQPRKAGAPASPCPKDGNQAHGRIGALLQPALGAGWVADCGQVCLGQWRWNPRAFLLPGAQAVSQQAKRPSSRSAAVTTAYQCRPRQGRWRCFLSSVLGDTEGSGVYLTSGTFLPWPDCSGVEVRWAWAWPGARQFPRASVYSPVKWEG